MSDGAHLGVSADRALETIFGGDQPTEDEKMTVAEMRAKLLAAPRWNDPAAMAGYGECAEVVAGEILRWALTNPQRYAACGAETEYDWDGDPAHGSEGMKPEHVIRPGLYDVLKADGIGLGDLGITGFQWGWAYNAAARCLELPPQPNPALMTFGSGILREEQSDA